MSDASQTSRPPPGLDATEATADAGKGKNKGKEGVFVLTSGSNRGLVLSLPTQGACDVGRGEQAKLRFSEADLSRIHARITVTAGRYLLEDKGSKNGTFVNERSITEAVQLKDGDKVRFGTTLTMNFCYLTFEEKCTLLEVYRARNKQTSSEIPSALLLEAIREASEFQKRAFSPPPFIRSVNTEVIYLPLDGVGGDLYHFSELGPNRMRVFLADATGHGIKASLSSMIILSEYDSVRRSDRSPSQVLAALNDKLTSAHGHLGVQLTALCADFDFNTGSVRYSTAAHPAPCLVRDSFALELESGGTFLGVTKNIEYPEHTIEMLRNDSFFLFTDGLCEQHNPKGEQYADRQLLNSFVVAKQKASPLHESVINPLKEFVAQNPFSDDITLIHIHWQPAP